jgi:formylglycine-generating enzyme required for sulfatase activity
MAGNVEEWVLDDLPNLYSGSSNRVNRGGSWTDKDASYLHSTFRKDFSPSIRYITLGFRVSDIFP